MEPSLGGLPLRRAPVAPRRPPARWATKLLAAVQDGTHSITEEANRALQRYIADPERNPRTLEPFGHRSGSLDYASPTWADMVASGELLDRYGAIAPPKDRQDRARWGRWFLYPICRLLELREEQRFHWERILARQRSLALEAGKALVARGLLDRVEDVWFLTFDEVVAGSLEGITPYPKDIAQRRRRHVVDKVVKKPCFIGPGVEVTAHAGHRLQGVGASPGSAEGTALQLRAPEEAPKPIPPNTIAVLRALDPAWTPLLPQFAGCVIERGGLLSHAAILAREYGVPLVIGVEDATACIAPGERLWLDGAAGWVDRPDAGTDTAPTST